jgi:hypothetical protein
MRRADSREDAIEEVAEAEVRVGDHVYPSSAQAARRGRTTLVILVRSQEQQEPRRRLTRKHHGADQLIREWDDRIEPPPMAPEQTSLPGVPPSLGVP